MSHPRDADRHRIATGLLQDADGPAWANLGCWSDAQLRDGDYASAAEALARAHADAVHLTPGEHVLDLGAGTGAGMLLWQQAYSADRVTAVEHQPRLASALQALARPAHDRVFCAAFDAPLPPELLNEPANAALCVDAAYHARSLDAFARTAASALHPGGRLAFSTLITTDTYDRASAWQRLRLRRLLALADIAPTSFASAATLRRTLAAAGWHDIQVDTLDTVLPGFAAFAAQRGATLPLTRRLRPDWLKIALTGQLCASLARDGLAAYVLVSARRL